MNKQGKRKQKAALLSAILKGDKLPAVYEIEELHSSSPDLIVVFEESFATGEPPGAVERESPQHRSKPMAKEAEIRRPFAARSEVQPDGRIFFWYKK